MFNKYFNKFLNYGIAVVLFFALFRSKRLLVEDYKTSKFASTVIIVVYILFLIIYIRYKSKFNLLIDLNNKKSIVYVLLVAFILRLLWIIFIPTEPTSDFGLMYSYAEEVANGSYYGFKEYAYFARFAHDTITVLYFSIFYHITENPLMIIKFLNVIWGTLSVCFLYLTIKEVSERKNAIIGAMILGSFPAFIMYTSETMSENIAMPFYLLGIYMFLRGLREKTGIKYYLMCGLALSVANMFRMVGAVFLLAFLVYTLVYKGLKKFIKSFPIIFLSYWILIFIISQSLLFFEITETHLWNSKEPSITSILKGTNVEFHGRWNEEDAKVPEEQNYDAEKIKEVSKSIIMDRFKNTPIKETFGHYVRKLSSQWGAGDYGAAGWVIVDASDTRISTFMKDSITEIRVFINLIYMTILIGVLKYLVINNYKVSEKINLFFILFGGFVLLYLISETQERYGFIISWVVVLFSASFMKTENIIQDESLILRGKEDEKAS